MYAFVQIAVEEAKAMGVRRTKRKGMRHVCTRQPAAAKTHTITVPEGTCTRVRKSCRDMNHSAATIQSTLFLSTPFMSTKMMFRNHFDWRMGYGVAPPLCQILQDLYLFCSGLHHFDDWSV